MSLGAVSKNAHQDLAKAANRLGSMFNCGEGGEPKDRFNTEANSLAKQIGTARFGVNLEYLHSCDEVEIKLG
jgi:glutamate synthase (ferredoxin)